MQPPGSQTVPGTTDIVILWIAHDRTVLQKWLEKKGDLKRGSGSDGAGDYGAVANSSVDHVEAAAL